ncbi:MAG: flavin reductase family protein [Clostridia bacterium]|nr:flavin reductase family protein [Clostridia bacterium]
MRKNFGKDTSVYPMPVFIVAAYDKDGKPNCMNAAWGGIYDTNQVMVCISEGHKTTKNILETKAFTVNIADASHVVEADYVGIASGNKEPDKMQKAGFTVTKSEFVNAPIINELPMAVECNLLKFNEDGICIGEIVNVSADESVLGDDGKIDPQKVQAITFDPIHNTYIKLGEKVGNAFSDGKKLNG